MSFNRPKAERNPFRERTIKTVTAIVAIIVSIVFLAFYFNSQKEEPLKTSFEVCDLSQEEIVEKFSQNQYKDLLSMQDYFFYGETLSVFDEEYDITKANSLLGKTVIVENVCTNEEYFYLIDDDVDGQIPLEQIPEGLYEVFVNVDMVKKRVVVEDKLNDEISLVRRNNKSKKASLIANKNMFDDRINKNVLNENYLFLNIEDNKNTSDYDIVLDAEHSTNTTGWHDDYGVKIDGMIEAKETYAMAEIVKEELEKSGLKVLLTRKDKDEIVNVYGEDGRLDRAYKSNAKYYVEMGWSRSRAEGLKVYNSRFSSIHFAGNIASYLLENTSLQASRNNGVYYAPAYNGLDGIMTIRETGGKALSAATVSDLAIEGNKSFAYNNRHALETISIEFITTDNEAEVKAWKKNRNLWAKELANAIISFLDMDDVNDLSD